MKTIKKFAKFLKDFFTIEITGDDNNTPLQSYDYLSRCNFLGHEFNRWL